jgi:hypothetical protein
VDHIAVDPLDKLMRRQSIQHDLAFGRVGGPHDKTGRREVILVLSHDLLLGLTGRERSHAEQHARHDCEFRNPIRIHLSPKGGNRDWLRACILGSTSLHGREPLSNQMRYSLRVSDYAFQRAQQTMREIN